MKKRKIKLTRILIVLCIVLLIANILATFLLRLLHQNTPEEHTDTVVEYVDPVYKNDYAFDHFQLDNGRLYYEDENYTSMFGIDVSFRQPNIDWYAVKEEGVEFAFIRTGYRGYESGILHEDTHFKQHIEGATSVGIPVGVYFFSQAITEEEAREEARFVLHLVQDYPLQLPIVFDMELVSDHDRIRLLGAREMTDIALAFVREIQQAGYEAMVYESSSWLISRLFMEDIQDECNFWVASYSTKKLPYEYAFTFWQYTNEGKLNGIAEDVDFNIYLKKKN